MEKSNSINQVIDMTRPRLGLAKALPSGWERKTTRLWHTNPFAQMMRKKAHLKERAICIVKPPLNPINPRLLFPPWCGSSLWKKIFPFQTLENGNSWQDWG